MVTLLLEKNYAQPECVTVEIKFRKKQNLKKISFRKPAHRKDVKVWPVIPKLIPNWKFCWFCRLICKRKTSSLITLNIYFLQAMQWLQKKAEFTIKQFLRRISKGASSYAT